MEVLEGRMETAAIDAASLNAKIERFAASHKPPVSPAPRSRVKPAGRNTQIASGALMGVPVVLLVLTRLIGGESFLGDILSFGLIGFICVALLYALSTWGSVYFANRKSRSADTWVAVGVLDRQKDYETGIPVDVIHLELEDGRRITVTAETELAERVEPGAVGWASIQNARLLKFA